jgi:hypothetical protein
MEIHNRKSSAFSYAYLLPQFEGYIDPAMTYIHNREELERCINTSISRFAFDLVLNKFHFTSNVSFNWAKRDINAMKHLSNNIMQHTPKKDFHVTSQNNDEVYSYFYRLNRFIRKYVRITDFRTDFRVKIPKNRFSIEAGGVNEGTCCSERYYYPMLGHVDVEMI